jgi:phthiocerol/phenolphthiocerol synthesis type-I polyketide synthase D
MVRWDIEMLRLKPDQYFAASSSALAPSFGAFVADAEMYDESHFRMSRSEASLMDPQQRLVMEQGGKLVSASHGAGRNPLGVSDMSLGVFVGISTSDYTSIVSRSLGSAAVTAYTATGRANSVAAGRLSYTYGAQGPCMAVDTACSSSLVCTHLAYTSWSVTQLSASLVSGVNLTLEAGTTLTFHVAGMLSSSGRAG